MFITRFSKAVFVSRLFHCKDGKRALILAREPCQTLIVRLRHCAQRRFWEAEFPEIDGENGLNCAGWAKKVTGSATIRVGSVGLDNDVTSAYVGKGSAPASLDRLVERMEREEFDLIAVGRVLLSDKDWVTKVEKGDYATQTGFNPASLAELS